MTGEHKQLTRPMIINTLVNTMPTRLLRDKFWEQESVIYTGIRAKFEREGDNRALVYLNRNRANAAAALEFVFYVHNHPEYIAAILQVALKIRKETGLDRDNT